jgi:glucose/arabinose dehydrogenase
LIFNCQVDVSIGSLPDIPNPSHPLKERFFIEDSLPIVGGLGGEQLFRPTVDGQTVLNEETLFQRMGRIRDVRQGPDGYIYLAIDDQRGGPAGIVRLEPAGAR